MACILMATRATKIKVPATALSPASVKVVLCLPLAVAPESFCGPLRKIYCVAAGVLRLGENEYATVSYPLHLWVNLQRL